MCEVFSLYQLRHGRQAKFRAFGASHVGVLDASLLKSEPDELATPLNGRPEEEFVGHGSPGFPEPFDVSPAQAQALITSRVSWRSANLPARVRWSPRKRDAADMIGNQTGNASPPILGAAHELPHPLSRTHQVPHGRGGARSTSEPAKGRRP